VNPRDPSAVLQAIRRNFKAEEDFQLIARTAIDTLDFTGEAMHRGSKMILDATGPAAGEVAQKAIALPANLNRLAPGVGKWRLVGRSMLVVQTAGGGRDIAAALVANPLLGSLQIVAVVSEDVNIEDNVELLWGIFTRFDPARDVIFTAAEFRGIAPVYRGVMGIDATWKEGYQKPLVMDPEIVQRVDNRWAEYWK
jgi:4-hydroxybenzoate decarboxylase subunit C